MKWFNLFKKTKKIAFLDGDQPLASILALYTKYLTGTETHLIRQSIPGHLEPHKLRDQTFNKIYLTGFRYGKETVDKYIGAFIQKSIADGYTDITVVSGDYDFIDIFKIAIQLNPTAKNVVFRMIVPSNCTGKVFENHATINNIEIVKDQNEQA